MANEVKVSVSDETLTFLRENLPEGLSDSGRIRIAIANLRFSMEGDAANFEDFLREQGLADDLDPEEIYIEGIKRAILESDDVDLTELTGLLSPDDSDAGDS